jgi:hypothetical protein
MSVVLMILLIAFCVQALVKFAVWFLVPYETRIRRIASYYDRNGRIISFYDSITLIIMVALVVLLMLTEMQYLSFITGLIVGMLTIQVFFHRFSTNDAPADRHCRTSRSTLLLATPYRPPSSAAVAPAVYSATKRSTEPLRKYQINGGSDLVS